MYIISIKSNLFDENLSKSLIEFFHSNIFFDSTSKLNLSSLEEIIISDNFGRDLKVVGKKYGLGYKGYTNNSYGQALGKVLHSKYEENNFRQTIFLRDDVVAGLFYEDKKEFSFRTIFHELCHVDDHEIQREIFSTKARYEVSEKGYSNFMYNKALTLWSEYIVEIKNSITVTPKLLSEIIYIDTINNMVKQTRKEINKEIESYRIHSNITKLFDYVNERVEILLIYIISLMGLVHGIGIKDDSIQDVKDGLSDELLLNVWEDFEPIMKELYSDYPEWNDIYELKKMFNSIEKIFKQFGVIPVDDGEIELYVNVPPE